MASLQETIVWQDSLMLFCRRRSQIELQGNGLFEESPAPLFAKDRAELQSPLHRKQQDFPHSTEKLYILKFHPFFYSLFFNVIKSKALSQTSIAVLSPSVLCFAL